MAPRLSVIVGVQHGRENITAILDALRPDEHADVEFLFCHAEANERDLSLPGSYDNVRTLRCSPGSLMPHMWRDGIRAASGVRVATTTVHCLPSSDWVAALLAAIGDDSVRGGTIANAAESDAKGDAIFLLRYSPYAPPKVRRIVKDVAADNALYPRDAILHEADLLERGFWEPSFHERFRAAGMTIELDPALHVVHRNRYGAREFIRQRLAHGQEFGLTRARRRPVHQRLLLLLVSPAVLPLLLARNIGAAIRNPKLRRPLLRAWFWLPVFAAAWTLGEAKGYARSLRMPVSPEAAL